MLLKKKKKSVYVLNLLWRENTILLAKEIIPPRVKTSVILSKSSRNNPGFLCLLTFPLWGAEFGVGVIPLAVYSL